jgi:hypothetical protein
MNITFESTASEHLIGVGELSKGILAQKFIKIQKIGRLLDLNNAWADWRESAFGLIANLRAVFYHHFPP